MKKITLQFLVAVAAIGTFAMLTPERAEARSKWGVSFGHHGIDFQYGHRGHGGHHGHYGHGSRYGHGGHYGHVYHRPHVQYYHYSPRPYYGGCHYYY